MTQYVYLYNNLETLKEILPTTKAVTHSNWSNIIMAPGVYQYNSFKYELINEGLYGIFNIGIDSGYRIIYSNDIPVLISAICWLTTYGNRDEGQQTSTLLTALRTRKVALQCSSTVGLARSLLSSVGITSRICRVLTASTPNGWNDGHVVLEVLINGIWYFWDILNNFYPSANGQQTNFNDYMLNLSADKIMIADAQGDTLSYAGGSNIIFDAFCRTAISLNNTVDRLYNIPGIDHTDGMTYFYTPLGTESRKSWVLGLSSSYRVVNYDVWLNMFYTGA